VTGDLKAATDVLVALASSAGLPADQARDEGLAFAAAIAEVAPRAAVDWARSQDAGPADLASVNAAFFDAASRGRKWRQAPTAMLSLLVASNAPQAPDYARALAEVASAACSLGEPTLRVTGNAAVAAAAQLSAARLRPSGPTGPLGAAGPGMPSAPQFPTPTLAPLPPGFPGTLLTGSAGADGEAGRHTDGVVEGSGEAQTQAATTGTPAPAAPPAPAKSVEELLAELDAMVGLDRVKREVHQQVAMLKVDALRRKAGLRNPDLTRHLVFVGNPGTGKTTVARMVGGIYRALGLLSTGQLVESDRSELVAGYLGQTAIKTAQVCAKANGGVLFVDEAYSLAGDEYGQEAINTLVKEMEDHRDDLVVIVAGYPDPMARFIAQNPGLASRFKTVIEFEDYTDEQLVAILHSLAGAADYEVTQEAEKRYRVALAAIVRGPAFGNGRFARNTLEEAIGRQAWRLRDEADPTTDQLRTLLPEDFDPPTDVAPEPADQPATGAPA
jgi:adenylate kinase family enzyme